MGCGNCPKKRVELKDVPSAMPLAKARELKSLIGERVRVFDRTGNSTFGRCVDLWFDVEESDSVEDGHLALKTLTGITVIGLNIVDHVEAFQARQ